MSALCAHLFVSLNYVLFIMACWPVNKNNNNKYLKNFTSLSISSTHLAETYTPPGPLTHIHHMPHITTHITQDSQAGWPHNTKTKEAAGQSLQQVCLKCHDSRAMTNATQVFSRSRVDYMSTVTWASVTTQRSAYVYGLIFSSHMHTTLQEAGTLRSLHMHVIWIMHAFACVIHIFLRATASTVDDDVPAHTVCACCRNRRSRATCCCVVMLVSCLSFRLSSLQHLPTFVSSGGS